MKKIGSIVSLDLSAKGPFKQSTRTPPRVSQNAREKMRRADVARSKIAATSHLIQMG